MRKAKLKLKLPRVNGGVPVKTGTILTAGATVLVTVAIAVAFVGPSGTAAAAPAAAASSLASDSSSASPSPSASASASPSASASASASASGWATATEDPADALADAVADTVSDDGKHVSVAVEDLSSGATASYNVTDDYVTASIIKVDILSTLLYNDQREGTSMSSSQRSLATAMIENSDNDAASALYDDAGGSSGITAANKAFGLTGTDIDDSAFGDTTTTATDQIRLLRQVFTSDSKLTSANRGYIQNLMSHVETDQRWGVSAGADDPSESAGDYLLKNGWLPRSATNLWEINSIGEVEHNGHEYLVAVLSRDNTSMDSGISVIEKVAEEAVDALG